MGIEEIWTQGQCLSISKISSFKIPISTIVRSPFRLFHKYIWQSLMLDIFTFRYLPLNQTTSSQLILTLHFESIQSPPHCLQDLQGLGLSIPPCFRHPGVSVPRTDLTSVISFVQSDCYAGALSPLSTHPAPPGFPSFR